MSMPDSVSDLILDSSNKFHRQMAGMLDDMMGLEYNRAQGILKSISHHVVTPTTRAKRAIQVGGDLLRAVFGVATQPEIDALVDEMSVIDVYLAKELHIARETTHLLTNMSDFNYNSILAYALYQNDTDLLLEEIGNKVTYLDVNVSSLLIDLQSKSKRNFYNNYLLSAAQAQLQSLHEFNRDLTTLEEALNTLSTGHLPTSLVPASSLQEALTTLAETLQTLDPKLGIVQLPIEHYYNSQIHSHWLEESFLFIAIPTPISKSDSVYTVYRATGFSVPIDAIDIHSKGTTAISNLPTYLAVSKTETKYIELDAFQYEACKQGVVTECTLPLPTLVPQHPTCLLALFLDVAEAVHRTCTYQIDLLAPIPHVAYPLTQESYLLSTSTSPSTLSCPHTPDSKLYNVAWSVVTVPCRCSVSNAHIQMTNTNLSCVAPLDTPVIMHCAVNLPVWRHFGNPPLNVSGITTWTKPLHHPLPDLNRARLRHMQRDLSLVNTARDLGEAANQIAGNSPSALSLSNRLDYLDNHTSHPIFETVCIVLSCLCLLLAGYAHWRVSVLAGITVPIRQSAASTSHDMAIYDTWREGIRAENKEWWDERIKEARDKIREKVEDSHPNMTIGVMEIVALVAAVLFVLALIWRCYKGCRLCHPSTTATPHRNPYFGLKINSGWKCVLLKAMPIHHDKNRVKVAGFAPDYREVRLTRPCGTMLHVDWVDPLLLILDDVRKEVWLPANIPVPLYYRPFVWHALKHPQAIIRLAFVCEGRHVEVPRQHPDSTLQRHVPTTATPSTCPHLEADGTVIQPKDTQPSTTSPWPAGAFLSTLKSDPKPPGPSSKKEAEKVTTPSRVDSAPAQEGACRHPKDKLESKTTTVRSEERSDSKPGDGEKESKLSTKV